jgi:putative membrane protein
MNMTKKVACCAAIVAGLIGITPPKAWAASDGDKKFLATAAQSDQNEIALSKLAEEKAMNPAVKAFAHKMVGEHEKMSASMKPFAESWGVTPRRDWTMTTRRCSTSSKACPATTSIRIT